MTTTRPDLLYELDKARRALQRAHNVLVRRVKTADGDAYAELDSDITALSGIVTHVSVATLRLDGATRIRTKGKRT